MTDLLSILGAVSDGRQSFIWHLTTIYEVLLSRTFCVDTNVLFIKRNDDPYVASVS